MAPPTTWWVLLSHQVPREPPTPPWRARRTPAPGRCGSCGATSRRAGGATTSPRPDGGRRGSGVHVDRASSAWLIRRWIHLIRRWIDPGAVVVSGPDDLPAGAVPFDVRGAEHGHQGQDCTFETLLRRHDLVDPVLRRIAAERSLLLGTEPA